MRTVDPKTLKTLDEVVILSSKGRGYTAEELLSRLYPEYPRCGHDHEEDMDVGLDKALEEGTMKSYELRGETFYCLTLLGVWVQQARDSVN